MTAELFYLALTAGLALILWVPYVVARIFCWGIADAAGYPTDPPELPGWARRGQRAHLNLLENLAPFAALVMVAQAVDVHSANTVLGAALFSGLGSRMHSCSFWVLPISERWRFLSDGLGPA